MQALVFVQSQAFWALGLSVVRSGLFAGFRLSGVDRDRAPEV